ncbi:MAG: hypothetical protein ABIA63_00095, partial [bacterium]
STYSIKVNIKFRNRIQEAPICRLASGNDFTNVEYIKYFPHLSDLEELLTLPAKNRLANILKDGKVVLLLNNEKELKKSAEYIASTAKELLDKELNLFLLDGRDSVLKSEIKTGNDSLCLIFGRGVIAGMYHHKDANKIMDMVQRIYSPFNSDSRPPLSGRRLFMLTESYKPSHEITNTEKQNFINVFGRDMVIIPAAADAANLFSRDPQSGRKTIPDTLLKSFADKLRMPVHFINGRIQKKITLNGKKFVLCAQEILPVVIKRKIKRTYPYPQKDRVFLGHAASSLLNKGMGDILIIRDKSFKVSGVLDANRTIEDKFIFLPISQMQEIFGLNGKVHCIHIQDCILDQDNLSEFKSHLEEVVKTTDNTLKVVALRDLAPAAMREAFSFNHKFWLPGLAVFLLALILSFIFFKVLNK